MKPIQERYEYGGASNPKHTHSFSSLALRHRTAWLLGGLEDEAPRKIEVRVIVTDRGFDG
jgi:hypothetical protein